MRRTKSAPAVVNTRRKKLPELTKNSWLHVASFFNWNTAWNLFPRKKNFFMTRNIEYKRRLTRAIKNAKENGMTKANANISRKVKHFLNSYYAEKMFNPTRVKNITNDELYNLMRRVNHGKVSNNNVQKRLFV